MKKYVCGVCGFVYDPAKGDPENDARPAPLLKICLTIGSVRFVEQRKTSLNLNKTNKVLQLPEPGDCLAGLNLLYT